MFFLQTKKQADVKLKRDRLTISYFPKDGGIKKNLTFDTCGATLKISDFIDEFKQNLNTYPTAVAVQQEPVFTPAFTEVRQQTTVKSLREYKGKNKLWLVDDYVVIDFETTGLNPLLDNIIEIGALKISCGEIVDEYTSLINPNCNISTSISNLTGITNDMVTNAPTLSDVLPAFLSFIETSYVLAHNANFDINFLYDNCIAILNNPFSNNFIDTMRISRLLFKDVKNHKLATLVETFNISGSVSHRSIDDCLCTYKLYEFMKNYIFENNLSSSFVFDKKKIKKTHTSNVESTVEVFNKPCFNVNNAEKCFDETHLFYNKICVFTGTLERYTIKEAMQIVSYYGGLNADNITKKTNFLILGNNHYCAQVKDGKSNKQKRAEQYILAGSDLSILSEQAFYDML